MLRKLEPRDALIPRLVQSVEAQVWAVAEGCRGVSGFVWLEMGKKNEESYL